MTPILASSLQVRPSCNGYYLYGTNAADLRTVCIACLGDGADLDVDADPTQLDSWASLLDLAEAFDITLS